MQGTKFELGQLVWTRGVADRIADESEFAKFATQSLKRYAKGDWGNICEEDKNRNDLAVEAGNLRIFSAYKHPILPKIWIITEADRSVTTTLFPDEY